MNSTARCLEMARSFFTNFCFSLDLTSCFSTWNDFGTILLPSLQSRRNFIRFRVRPYLPVYLRQRSLLLINQYALNEFRCRKSGPWGDHTHLRSSIKHQRRSHLKSSSRQKDIGYHWRALSYTIARHLWPSPVVCTIKGLIRPASCNNNDRQGILTSSHYFSL